MTNCCCCPYTLNGVTVVVQLSFMFCQEKGSRCKFLVAHPICPKFHMLSKMWKVTCQMEVTTIAPSGGYHK